jgi:hypothetical protein
LGALLGAAFIDADDLHVPEAKSARSRPSTHARKGTHSPSACRQDDEWRAAD